MWNGVDQLQQQQQQQERPLSGQIILDSYSGNIKPIKQGVIKKYTNMLRRFQQRFFVLNPDVLTYYKKDGGVIVERGVISLKLAKVDPKSQNDKDLLIHSGTAEIHLKFQNLEDKKEWFYAILECQQQLQQRQEKLAQHYAQHQQEIEEVEGGEYNIRSQSYLKRNKSQELTNIRLGLDKEIKDALSIALQTNILKEDSQLSRYIAETWAAQSQLEEALSEFKEEVMKLGNLSFQKIGEKIEQASSELKQCITNALKQIDQTKLQIIRILEKQDQKIIKEKSIEKCPLVGLKEENSRAYYSFSQDFNDIIEQKKNLESIFEDPKEDEEEKMPYYHNKKKLYQQNDEKIGFKEQKQLIDENIQLIQKEYEKSFDQERFNSSKIEEYRTTLPVLKPQIKLSIWKIIKDSLGKDLYRISVPVYFNSPLSILQQCSELMEYESLLEKANLEEDPLRRLLYVAAFGIAQYKCTDKRLSKPFNPILGETFELQGPKYKYFAEQVSHHPPVSAVYSFSDSYELWYHSGMKVSFWGKHIEVKPTSLQHIKLKKFNEHFIIERPSATVNNIIYGEMYTEIVGIMMVKNLQTMDFCEIQFKKRGWSGKNPYEFQGFCFNSNQQKEYAINGKYVESFVIQNLKTNQEETIWTCNPNPPDNDLLYNFTYFSLQLNHLPAGLKNKIAPTDSRLRPDQRALEEGNLILAADEKHRLEEKQRQARKEREEKGWMYKAKYFSEGIDQESGETCYQYIRDYWSDRKNKNWEHLDDIF